MKKYLLFSIIFIFVLATVTFAIVQPPPPFDKIKAYAQMGQFRNGVWLSVYEKRVNGDLTHEFRLAYFPPDQSVCIGGGTRETYEVFCWSPQTGCCEYLGGNFIIPMEEKEGCCKAYDLLKKMVELKLL